MADPEAFTQTAVLSDGLNAVETARSRDQAVSTAVILNILARRRNPAPAVTILTPDALPLRNEPQADCARYDSLRRQADGTTQVLNLMGTLKLYGMRRAYDEIMTTAT